MDSCSGHAYSGRSLARCGYMANKVISTESLAGGVLSRHQGMAVAQLVEHQVWCCSWCWFDSLVQPGIFSPRVSFQCRHFLVFMNPLSAITHINLHRMLLVKITHRLIEKFITPSIFELQKENFLTLSEFFSPHGNKKYNYVGQIIILKICHKVNTVKVLLY